MGCCGLLWNDDIRFVFAAFATLAISFATVYHSAYANHSAVCGNVAQNDGVCTNFDVVAKGDVAKHLCTGTNNYVVAQGWMAFVVLLASSTKSCALVDGTVVANDGRFADNDAVTMVDKQIFAYLCTGMNFDTGEKSRCVAKQFCYETEPYFVEKSRNAIPKQRVNTGVQKEYFYTTARCGVTLFDGFYKADFIFTHI